MSKEMFLKVKRISYDVQHPWYTETVHKYVLENDMVSEFIEQMEIMKRPYPLNKYTVDEVLVISYENKYYCLGTPIDINFLLWYVQENTHYNFCSELGSMRGSVTDEVLGSLYSDLVL